MSLTLQKQSNETIATAKNAVSKITKLVQSNLKVLLTIETSKKWKQMVEMFSLLTNEVLESFCMLEQFIENIGREKANKLKEFIGIHDCQMFMLNAKKEKHGNLKKTYDKLKQKSDDAKKCVDNTMPLLLQKNNTVKNNTMELWEEIKQTMNKNMTHLIDAEKRVENTKQLILQNNQQIEMLETMICNTKNNVMQLIWIFFFTKIIPFFYYSI